MADERTRTTGNTATLDHPADPPTAHDANLDSLTDSAAAHPVGTGVGAAGGGTIGAVIGGAVGGPVGAMVGAAIGGITGGLAGKGIAESISPAEEDAFWRDNYSSRPYAQGRSYDDLRPAYQYGWESRCRFDSNCSWSQAESELANGWEKAKGNTRLGWHEAKDATRDAWNRIDQRISDIGTATTSPSTVTTGGTVSQPDGMPTITPVTGSRR
jgi:hypothetical protein